MLLTINNILFDKQQSSPLPADNAVLSSLMRKYASADHRLFLLDYDGTIVPFQSNAEKAVPDKELIDIIHVLTSDQRNKVAIVSGRTRDFLEKCFADFKVILVAEHGANIRYPDGEWMYPEDKTFPSKNIIRRILLEICEEVPGSRVEEKDYSLVWHYRAADADLSRDAAQRLKARIYSEVQPDDVDIYDGNMIVEVRVPGINKGIAVTYLRVFTSYDFIFAAGDDRTDEDMFYVLPDDAYSIKIGNEPTAAKYYVNTVAELRRLISHIAVNS
ncbi:MAG TPA: trehalose-phosphatase [Spirochaetota bacterium]|nr:trehalose-phosphatase [Spirochaetota bacterium]